MTTYVVVAILTVAVLGIVFRRAYKTFVTFRGMRVLTCPDSGQTAGVELKSCRASLTGLFGKPVLRVQECSRWPKRAGCDEGCIREVEAAPANHRVPVMLTEWCHEHACVCCGAPIRKVHVGPHEPHLMSPELRIIEWRQVPPQNLPQVLDTCGPVCENCLLAETHTW